jgi:hypothetical protein
LRENAVEDLHFIDDAGKPAIFASVLAELHFFEDQRGAGPCLGVD